VALLVSSLTRLGTRSEASNILILSCLGHVELSRIIIITHAYSKIRVWFWHNALARDP
jgi:hypothetical protein